MKPEKEDEVQAAAEQVEEVDEDDQPIEKLRTRAGKEKAKASSGKKAKAKARTKAKAKAGDVVRVVDVEKEMKQVIPLIDKKVALDGVCKNYIKRLNSDSDFKSWAETFVTTLQENLSSFAQTDEELVDNIQTLRVGDYDGGKMLAKGFLNAFQGDSVRQLITINKTLKDFLQKATPVADRIAAYNLAGQQKKK